MEPSDRKAFAHCLLAAAAVYEKRLSEPVIQIWWTLLIQYDIAAVETAFAVHMADPDSGQFMPKPADVVRRISGTTQDSALRAWAIVDKAVRQVGPWITVTFDDPVTMRVLVDMGGWAFLGDKQEREWSFVAKEFENRYRGYKQRGEMPEHPARLLGHSDATNQRNGHAASNSVLIGDPARAAHVLASGSFDPSLKVMRPVSDIGHLLPRNQHAPVD